MRDFDWQLIQILQGKSDKEVEKIVLQLCDTYGLNYYQTRNYVDDLLDKLK